MGTKKAKPGLANISLRDFLAAQAMQSLLLINWFKLERDGREPENAVLRREALAPEAYAVADAMIKESETS